MGAAARTRLRLAALGALLGACLSDPAREADRAFTAGVARVESVELELVSRRPPRLRVDVRGSVPDACTEVESPDPRFLGASVEITLATRRPFGADCPPSETRFERSIPLMLSGEIGAWVVDVNGVRSTVLVPPDARESTLDPLRWH